MAVQNHIHLSSTLGGAPENSPDETYTVHVRQEKFVVYTSVMRSINGTTRVGALEDANGPMVYTDFSMVLSLTAAELATLKAELGREVYFVDHDHAADGTNHTSDVVTMLLQEIGEPENLDPMLNYFTAKIVLVDTNTEPQT